MRDIKYRVWDVVNKEYSYPGSKEFLLSMSGYLYDGLGCIYDEEHIVQQYTGLKDKNGIEIYEGDIVSYGCDTQYYESVVAYKAPTFIGKNFFYKQNHSWKRDAVWDVVWKKHGLDALNENYYRCDMSIVGHNFIEVIGNIYENPELLNTTE
jgi:uncharacterized phage protein (TIGR01671 family)